MKAIGRAWEEPAQLLVQLEELKKHEITEGWSNEVSATVQKLGPAISVGAAETTEILQHLEQLAGETPTLVTKVNDESLAQNLSRTSQALGRRIPVWKQIGQMGGMSAADAPAAGRRSAQFQQVPERDRPTHEQFVGRTRLAEVSADRVAARLGRTPAQQRRAVAARPGPAGAQAFEPDVGHFAPAAVPYLRADGRAAPGDVAAYGRTGGIESFAATPGDLREERTAQRRPAAGTRLPIPGGQPGSGTAGIGRADRNALSQRQPADCRHRRVAQSHDSQAGTGIRAGPRHDPGSSRFAARA